MSFLFGNYRIATVIAGSDQYGHTFGGPPDRRGASRNDCGGILIHLLHRFDLSDPKIPITIPGVRWLPLYYCFDFRVNELGYRLVSDDVLVVYFPHDDPNISEHESWPDDDFPLQFPISTVEVGDFQYDPTILEDAYDWAGVFGIGKLSAQDQLIAKGRVYEESEGLGLELPETEEEFHEALSNPFIQGRPESICLNPECPNHTRSGHLSSIALLPSEPVEGVRLFGRWGDFVQLIFQMCEECHTIRVSNQCT